MLSVLYLSYCTGSSLDLLDTFHAQRCSLCGRDNKGKKETNSLLFSRKTFRVYNRLIYQDLKPCVHMFPVYKVVRKCYLNLFQIKRIHWNNCIDCIATVSTVYRDFFASLKLVHENFNRFQLNLSLCVAKLQLFTRSYSFQYIANSVFHW